MITILIISISCAIVISAVCSVCEAMLYSLSMAQVELMSERHPKQAGKMKTLKENIDQPITAILTLNTIANTIGASVAGAAAVEVFGQGSLIWFSIFFTIAILFCSEILPKTFGVVYSKQLAPYFSPPLFVITTFLKPVIWACQMITSLVPESDQRNQVSADEVRTTAKLSFESGKIGADQEQIISNILQLSNTSVRHAMTPRTVTYSLEKSMMIEEAARLEERCRMHSRIPIYDQDKKNVIGIVLTQDILIAANTEKRKNTLYSLLCPVHFVPETAQLDSVFLDFLNLHQHLFVVVDEYGSVTGIISMEDIIEEIVGKEIIDESDKTKDMRELARAKLVSTSN